MHWPFLISLALIFIFSFALGIFTLLHNPKSKVHQLWSLTTIGIAIWSGSLFLIIYLTPDKNLISLLFKLEYLGATMTVIFFLHFLLIFLLNISRYKIILLLNYLIGIFLYLTIFIDNWFIKTIKPLAGFKMLEEYGPTGWVYSLYYFIIVILFIVLLLKGYKENEGLKRKQILIILWAGIIGFGGGMTNFLPQFFNIYPFGTFVVFLYPILITYGIFLPNIKINVRI